MVSGDRFVELPADVMFRWLETKGFRRSEGRSHREVVYERGHDRDPSYKVIVYTSIAAGSSRARAKGADAIRVCAIHEPPGQRGVGIAKLPKVLRTAPSGSSPEQRQAVLLGRVLERMRDAYARINRALRFYAELEAGRGIRQPGLTDSGKP